jgi:hypothetical protein
VVGVSLGLGVQGSVGVLVVRTESSFVSKSVPSCYLT